MKDPITREQAIILLAKRCSKEELCISDVRAILDKWNVDKDWHETIIDKLIADKFIDESRFAGFYVTDKFNLYGWGRLKLVFELERKKIGTEDINSALSMIDEAQYLKKLENIIQSKYKTITNKEPMAIKASLARYAASKGYEEELIMKIIDEF